LRDVLLLNASTDESDLYSFWLEGCGYRVTVAQSVAAARQIARKDTVDVLVIRRLLWRRLAAPRGGATVE